MINISIKAIKNRISLPHPSVPVLLKEAGKQDRQTVEEDGVLFNKLFFGEGTIPALSVKVE